LKKARRLAGQYRAKCESKRMVNIRTQTDNSTEEMIAEFLDIARRKRRTVEHIEAAIARRYQRQGRPDVIANEVTSAAKEVDQR
jgi:hypothetical protein